MAIDQRKRQKKLERRKAKQRAERRERARREAGGLPARIQQAAGAPILHCCITACLWQTGIGQVFLSRLCPNGKVAFGAFLVDIYCLGVKNAMAEIVVREQYDSMLYQKLQQEYGLVPLKPECARKLVEGAVAYARDLGFSPHPDYRAAQWIFGDIDAGACPEQFSYGKDGKPFFVAGPYDDHARCEWILQMLRHRLGPDGFHYMIPL